MADFFGQNAFRLGRITVEQITAHIDRILIGAVRAFAHVTLNPRNIRQLITLNQIEKEVGLIEKRSGSLCSELRLGESKSKL